VSNGFSREVSVVDILHQNQATVRGDSRSLDGRGSALRLFLSDRFGREVAAFIGETDTSEIEKALEELL
jgi:hypothetical protein